MSLWIFLDVPSKWNHYCVTFCDRLLSPRVMCLKFIHVYSTDQYFFFFHIIFHRTDISYQSSDDSQFLKGCHTVFQNGPILRSNQQGLGVPVFHTLGNTYLSFLLQADVCWFLIVILWISLPANDVEHARMSFRFEKWS